MKKSLSSMPLAATVSLLLLFGCHSPVKPSITKPGSSITKPEKPADKPEKPADKPKKPADKPEPPADKPEPPAEKPEPPAEKPAPKKESYTYTVTTNAAPDEQPAIPGTLTAVMFKAEEKDGKWTNKGRKSYKVKLSFDKKADRDIAFELKAASQIKDEEFKSIDFTPFVSSSKFVLSQGSSEAEFELSFDEKKVGKLLRDKSATAFVASFTIETADDLVTFEEGGDFVAMSVVVFVERLSLRIVKNELQKKLDPSNITGLLSNAHSNYLHFLKDGKGGKAANNHNWWVEAKPENFLTIKLGAARNISGIKLRHQESGDKMTKSVRIRLIDASLKKEIVLGTIKPGSKMSDLEISFGRKILTDHITLDYFESFDTVSQVIDYTEIELYQD